MPVGFQLINSQGAVQIGGSNINMALAARGQITIPERGVGDIHASPQIQLYRKNPFLCLCPLTTYAYIRKVIKSGDTYSYVINGGYAGATFAAPQAETFDWYIFYRMPPVLLDNAGIQVFNAGGEIVFSSASRPMRVVVAAQILTAPLMTTPMVINTRISGTYAAYMTQGRISGATAAVQLGFVFKDAIKINATGAVTAACFDFRIQTPDVPVTNTGGQILLVDVSGL